MAVCIYCGKKGKMTKEHVPPKGLFPKPRPSNLITVPACKECNNSKSIDDEYIKMLFNIDYRTFLNPQVRNNYGSVIKSIKLHQKRGEVKKLIKSAKPVKVVCPITGKIQETIAVHPNSIIAENQAKDIVRGLYYHHCQDYKHDLFVYEAYWVDYQKNDEWKNLFPELNASKKNTIMDGVFWYKYIITMNNMASIWRLCFYESLTFIVIMRKKLMGEV